MVTHRDHSVLPSDAADVRDINLIQPPLGRSSTCSSMSFTRTEPDVAGSAPFFSPSLEYTMATHIMQPPASSPSAGRVYQTTNPCMAIRADVLAVARLERYATINMCRMRADISAPYHCVTQGGYSNHCVPSSRAGQGRAFTLWDRTRILVSRCWKVV